MPIAPAEWERDVAPLVNGEAFLRGAPMRADAQSFSVQLEGEWTSWPYDEAFVKLIPIKVARALAAQGVKAPGQVQMVGQ